MRILWVKTGPLLPLDTGGKRRTHAMLTEISKNHEVHYLSLLPEGTQLDPNEESDPYAAQKTWVTTRCPGKQSPLFWLDLARNTLFSSRPFALHKYEVLELQHQLLAISKSNAFDLVICDFLAPALNFVRIAFTCPTVLFQHNIESQIWRRLAASQTSVAKRWYFGLQYRRMYRWERHLSALFDGVITVSPDDAELARSDYGLTNVLGHVPTGVDVAAFLPAPVPPAERPFTMGFLGSMDWTPNSNAVDYFVRDILPVVRASRPDARFKIIGRNPPASIRKLAVKDAFVEVTGTVADVQPHVHGCDVIVVPLKAGGGTRLKIFEAMAMGVPVVSTTIGVEGLAVNHGDGILIADEPGDFAATLIRLANDRTLQQRMASQCRRQAESSHSWLSTTRYFLELCARTDPSNLR